MYCRRRQMWGGYYPDDTPMNKFAHACWYILKKPQKENQPIPAFLRELMICQTQNHARNLML